MKKLLVFPVLFFLFFLQTYAQIAVNNDGSPPHSSSMLEVKSTDRGFLPPRLTVTERNEISSPANGLIIFCSDCGTCGLLQLWKSTGWVDIGSGCDTIWENNAAPEASDVLQAGSITVGCLLTGSYLYSDAEKDLQEVSVFDWYRADDAAGLNESPILGGTNTTYRLVSADLGKYIRFAVTPTAVTGASPGTQVKAASFSGPVTLNFAPVASNVAQSGSARTYAVLTATYTYSDFEEDPEANSLFRWYRANDGSGTGEVMITGATSRTYTMVKADLNKYIRAGVIPYAQSGSSPGLQVNAASFTGPVLAGTNATPVAGSVSQFGYTWEGAILTGGYTYSDAEGDAEGTSVFQWYRADNSGGTNETAIGGANASTYTLTSADAGKWVRISVTPEAVYGTSPGTLVKAASFTGPVVGTTVAQDIENPATGKHWLDRNLGAKRVALSSADGLGYGSMIQWGRATDGHELIKWTAAGVGAAVNWYTTTTSATDAPGHSLFILSESWRNPKNDFLWQGSGGLNNPCPTGYRVPTKTEFENEKSTWSAQSAAGAYNSPLKFPVAGCRSYGDNSLTNTNSYGYYWSSTISGDQVYWLYFTGSSATVTTTYRGFGFSVRCILDYPGASNTIPVASAAAQTGNLWEGSVLSGTYTYSDFEGDVEGSSAFQWYRADNGSGLNESAITGATSNTYSLSSGDAGKYTRIAVTPVALTGSTPGDQVKAATFLGPVNPVIPYQEVTNTGTGKIWLDHNMGAIRIATAKNDFYGYGSLFQWGRLADHHELIEWYGSASGTPQHGTTASTSSADDPGHHFFIVAADWRNPANDLLWQGVSGTNNPCPIGFRLPTSTELDAERASWSSQNSDGAFASPLKLAVSGYRRSSDGNLSYPGSYGYYQGSTVSGANVYFLYFTASSASLISNGNRGEGRAVRCIKD